jgi:hypothetical protein
MSEEEEILQPSGFDAIDEKDKALMKYLSEYPDASLADLGRVIGMTASGVRKRMMRPVFQKFLRQLREGTEDIILRGQRAAAMTLLRLTRSSNEKTALEASRILLTPLLAKTTTENKTTKELIFRAQIGTQGQLLQEVIDVALQEDASGREGGAPLPQKAGDRLLQQLYAPIEDDDDDDDFTKEQKQ